MAARAVLAPGVAPSPPLTARPTPSLEGVPPETVSYRLGNLCPLDWVIDPYQVTEDKRSGVRSDPNRPDDPEYIVRLVGQVVRVSVETVKIVAGLPEAYAGSATASVEASARRATRVC